MADPFSAEFVRGIIQTLVGAGLALLGAWLSDKRAFARERRDRLFNLRKEALMSADRVWLATLSLMHDTSTPWTEESLNTKVAEIVPPLYNARVAFGLSVTPASKESVVKPLFAAIEARGTSGFTTAHNALMEAVTEALREVRDGWAREVSPK
jgi:hypothetical protein